MTDAHMVDGKRMAMFALTALLLGGASGKGQEVVVQGDSAAVAATGHGRVELDIRRGGTTDRGDLHVALDAQIAARIGMAAGAATIAIILGAGGLASRRRRDGSGVAP